ncbi:MAG TPA: hypothetical protein VM578_13455 [Candidatus Saccharimonadales bacterium]|nr:hypothetical protein [Candidatus Saccharimonadales bacterium]
MTMVELHTALPGTASDLYQSKQRRTKNSRRGRLVRGDLPQERPDGAAANRNHFSEKVGGGQIGLRDSISMHKPPPAAPATTA